LSCVWNYQKKGKRRTIYPRRLGGIAMRSGGRLLHVLQGGKVVEAHPLKPAAAPHPVAADGVDHQRNGCGVDAVGFEVGALGHGAGDDGGCRCAEDSLEHDVHPQRDVEAQMRMITPLSAQQRGKSGKGSPLFLPWPQGIHLPRKHKRRWRIFHPSAPLLSMARV